MKVTHHKIASRTLDYSVNGKRTKCTPKTKNNACYPISFFDLIEQCAICNTKF